MVRQAALPPFLQKLKVITNTIPAEIAGWAENGTMYVVHDNDKFEEVLKQHFKGNRQTFIRQLHFYGFRKLDASNNGSWSFSHENFRKDCPHLLNEIRRKTRTDQVPPASQIEVEQLKSQVASLESTVNDLREKLDSVLSVLDKIQISSGNVDAQQQQQQQVMAQAVSTSTHPSEISRKRQRVKMEQQEQEQPLLEDFEPLSVDFADDMEELMELSFEEQSELAAQLAQDVAQLSVEEDEDENSKNSMATSAKAVADATELDASSVQKVLSFLKNATKNEKHKGNDHFLANLSYPQIQSAIVKIQEVGAN